MTALQRYDNPIFAKQYDMGERGSRHGDIETYVRLLKKINGPVLELGCGSGRITIPLKQNGVDITGLDFAAAMVKLGRAYAKREHLDIKFVIDEAVTFKLPKTFGAIIFPYNSIRQIPENKIPLLFRNVARHLAPHGKFIFDFSQHINTGKIDRSFTPWSEPMTIPGLGCMLARRMKRSEDVKKQTWTITYQWRIQPKNDKAILRKTTMVFSTRPAAWYAEQARNSGLALESQKNMSVKTHDGQSTHTIMSFNISGR